MLRETLAPGSSCRTDLKSEDLGGRQIRAILRNGVAYAVFSPSTHLMSVDDRFFRFDVVGEVGGDGFTITSSSRARMDKVVMRARPKARTLTPRSAAATIS